MTRTLLFFLLVLVLALAVAGWTVRAIRWAVTLPGRHVRAPEATRVRVA